MPGASTPTNEFKQNRLISMQPKSTKDNQALSSSATMMLASILYAVSLMYCLAEFASVEWSMYGFTFGEVGILDALILIFVLLVWAIVMPKRISKASSMFLVITHAFVCIPSAVMTVSLNSGNEGHYYPLLIMLGTSFALTCLASRSLHWPTKPRESAPLVIKLVFVAWCVSFILMVLIFGAIMDFPSLAEIYLQRELGKANNAFEGYLQTYFGYVFSPTLLILGLARKNYLFVIAGWSGGIVLFMVTAEKAVFMYPIFVSALYIVLRSRSGMPLNGYNLYVILSILLIFSTLFFSQSDIAKFIANFIGTRSLLTPGLFVPLYYDYFGEVSYTFGSHISGISSLIDGPMQLTSQHRWPSIGHLVGEDHIGITGLNANATFIASDGIASFGLQGIFFSFLIFSLFLFAIDYSSRGVPLDISLPILLPLALALTNGSLFTVCLSFGGFFLIFFFAYLFKPANKKLTKKTYYA